MAGGRKAMGICPKPEPHEGRKRMHTPETFASSSPSSRGMQSSTHPSSMPQTSYSTRADSSYVSSLSSSAGTYGRIHDAAQPRTKGGRPNRRHLQKYFLAVSMAVSCFHSLTSLSGMGRVLHAAPKKRTVNFEKHTHLTLTQSHTASRDHGPAITHRVQDENANKVITPFPQLLSTEYY